MRRRRHGTPKTPTTGQRPKHGMLSVSRSENYGGRGKGDLEPVEAGLETEAKVSESPLGTVKKVV